MVVKIVNSEPDPSVVKEVICKHCGVTLSYVPADVDIRVDSDMDSRHLLTCPNCDYVIHLRNDN